MTISYKWLSEYLPVTVEPERLSKILTSIGLEVESLEKYEEVKGGLRGLVIGEVLHVEKHPDADKLTITKVNIGRGDILSIVCGAPNVATGQKVVVATVGTTIYPTNGEPVTMKIAKIRGVESHGMICAEDEIGLGTSHAGIMVLPGKLQVGSPVAGHFQPYQDHIFEIGLTPNRMEAMSHWGVARDICAYLSYHDKKHYKPKLPNTNGFKVDNTSLTIDVKVENATACPRYSGISLANINIADSPKWLQQKLKVIGQRPINNIVDISNFIQHETGQPLHAFDADAITGNKVIVKNLPEGTRFITLDEKERTLSRADLMICNAKEPMCIAGVYGGANSGVTEKTKNIFLESACFDPVLIRKTSFRHGLRTDAVSRFEKGTDISGTVNVLKRAAGLIRDICGGEIASPIVDVYPEPKEKTRVAIRYQYLKKLSGKNYHPGAVKDILCSLGFEMVNESFDELTVAVPYHKPDISLPADLAEEILRIDGLDSIEIPGAITITPSVEENYAAEEFREKVAGFLVGNGFHEIMTNSITNAAYFNEEELGGLVKMMNSLSTVLNVMRPSLLETSLEAVAHNLNRKNNNLKFFEFGKSYGSEGPGQYKEGEKLCVLVTGRVTEGNWKVKNADADIYYLKGIVTSVFQLLGLNPDSMDALDVPKLDNHQVCKINGMIIGGFGEVNRKVLARFDIRQPVYFAGFGWEPLVTLASRSTGPGEQERKLTEIPRFPAIRRDLAIVVPQQLPYREVEQCVQKIQLNKLRAMKLFDIFESDKLGAGKKSLAINFTFLDEEKTMTDKEIDEWMGRIMTTLEKKLHAEIRK